MDDSRRPDIIVNDKIAQSPESESSISPIPIEERSTITDFVSVSMSSIEISR